MKQLTPGQVKALCDIQEIEFELRSGMELTTLSLNTLTGLINEAMELLNLEPAHRISSPGETEIIKFKVTNPLSHYFAHTFYGIKTANCMFMVVQDGKADGMIFEEDEIELI